ncbi:MAG TPA: NUDIX domain-containing protein, partial [Vicinamibacteria bacterium]|nr:NUDIX domain-containing protein [Vicinamibacteria bacterium]
ADGVRVLLLRHRKLERWLQPGGHADPGESAGEQVALREAAEETGIRGLALHPGAPRPLDLDVHRIPARPGEPTHAHLDLRYLVVAPPGSVPAPDLMELHAARWVGWDEVASLGPDAGLRRALAKARAIVSPPDP